MRLIIRVLTVINAVLKFAIELLHWTFNDEESEEVETEPTAEPLWVQQVRKCTNDKVAEYLKVINRDSSGNMLKKEIAVSKFGGRNFLKFPLTKTWEDEHLRARKFQLGTSFSSETNKNILLIGAKFSKKKSFIDTLANHALGVTWKDKFNIGITSHSDLESSSKEGIIDIFTIPSTADTKMHFTVNVLNLPKFNASQSDEDINKMMDQLAELIRRPSGHRIDCLHAVVVVFNPHYKMLLPLYKHAHEYLVKIIGSGIAENIFHFFPCKRAGAQNPTFASDLKKAGMPQKVDFPFHCGTFFQDKHHLPGDEMEKQWSEMQKDLDAFLGKLEDAVPQSLMLSSQNLDRRNKATEGLQQLYILIRIGCQQIQNAQSAMKHTEKEGKGCTYISEVKNFEYYTYTIRKTKRDLAYSGKPVTNCSVCFVTCHDPCALKDDDQKAKCSVMRKGYCEKCPGKCYWDKHFNRAYVVSVKIQKVQANFSDIHKKYKMLGKGKVSELLNAISNDIKATENNVMEDMKKTIHNVRVIHEMSGKPGETPVGNILEEIILGEKRDQLDGWKERIDVLQSLKQRVEMELQDESIDEVK